MDYREAHPEPFLDLDYAELVADPMAAAGRIYDFAGEELDAEAEACMREWAEENVRDRRPVHHYTLERFGYTEAGLARDFARYRGRFL